MASIHSSISFFIKTILLGDILTFLDKTFLIKRLIVYIEIPSNSETSLRFKKSDFVDSCDGDLNLKSEINLWNILVTTKILVKK